MIKFRCKNCGQKLSIPEIHAGKKGKCPKCKNIILTPKAEDLQPVASESNSSGLETISKSSDLDPSVFDAPQKSKAAAQPIGQYDISDRAFESARELEGRPAIDETEPVGKRKLPWVIDMFLYPITVSGVIHLVIFSFLPRMLLPLGHLAYWLHPPIFGLGFLVIYVGYLLYCLSDYIRDSADGNRRAPDINISPTVLLHMGELILPILNMFVCVVVCVGPLLAYFTITKRTDFIFWLLITYSILFLPMVLLAMVLFDSFRALNPVLIVGSMFSVFFQYCGLILLFSGFGGLIALITSTFLQQPIFGHFFGTVCIYLTMVMAHLLGRFYWRYQEKLYWEV